MKKVFSIAHVTFSEIARDRIFYSFLAFFAILLGASYLASQMSFLASTRIILDFGNSISLFGLSLFSISQGAGMIAKEYERQTIQLAQSKPVTPFQFLVGKLLGLGAIVFLNALVLLVVELLLLLALGAKIGSTFFVSFFFVFLQSWMLASISIFFVSFTTVTLSVVLTVGVLILGSTTSEFIRSFYKIESDGIRNFFMGLAYVFPSFETFNLGPKLTYYFPLKPREVLLPLLYSLSHSLIFIYLASRLIRKKEY